jgi:hypothetical protein
MDARFYLQFAAFENPGLVRCDTLEEACAFFAAYDRDERRREREGVTSYWVTCDDRDILGASPPGWVPDDPVYECRTA